MNPRTSLPADLSIEQEKIAAALHPVLASLIEQCQQSPGNVAALVMSAAGTLAGMFAQRVQVVSIASFHEGVAAGMLRSSGGPLQ